MDESTDLPGRTAEGAVIKFTARSSHKETVLCDGFQTTFNTKPFGPMKWSSHAKKEVNVTT